MTAKISVSENDRNLMRKKFDFMANFEGRGYSGSGTPGNAGNNIKSITISRSDARDAGKYQIAKQKAAQRGLPLIVSD